MASFNDYIEKNGNGGKSSDLKAMEILKEVSSRYEGASEGEMLKAILKEAESCREKGTLTDADLDAFYNAFSPVLDGVQRRRLEKIIAKLKKG